MPPPPHSTRYCTEPSGRTLRASTRTGSPRDRYPAPTRVPTPAPGDKPRHRGEGPWGTDLREGTGEGLGDEDDVELGTLLGESEGKPAT